MSTVHVYHKITHENVNRLERIANGEGQAWTPFQRIFFLSEILVGRPTAYFRKNRTHTPIRCNIVTTIRDYVQTFKAITSEATLIGHLGRQAHRYAVPRPSISTCLAPRNGENPDEVKRLRRLLVAQWKMVRAEARRLEQLRNVLAQY